MLCMGGHASANKACMTAGHAQLGRFARPPPQPCNSPVGRYSRQKRPHLLCACIPQRPDAPTAQATKPHDLCARDSSDTHGTAASRVNGSRSFLWHALQATAVQLLVSQRLAWHQVEHSLQTVPWPVRADPVHPAAMVCHLSNACAAPYGADAPDVHRAAAPSAAAHPAAPSSHLISLKQPPRHIACAAGLARAAAGLPHLRCSSSSITSSVISLPCSCTGQAAS